MQFIISHDILEENKTKGRCNMSERTDALRRAQAKYKKKYAHVDLRLDPEMLIALKELAEKSRLSVNAYLVQLIQDALKQGG